MFKELSKLKILSFLWKNKITTLTGMNNLEVLDLSHNEIINLPNGTFNGLSNLRNLNLRDNQITTNLTDGSYPLLCSSPYTLRKLKALTKLNQKSLKLFGSCKSTNTSDVTVYDLNNIKSRMLFIITIMLLLSRS